MRVLRAKREDRWTRTRWAVVAPLLLCALSGAPSWSAQVKLVWEPSVSPHVSGYRVHYGPRSRQYSASVDAGMDTEITIEGLEEGRAYFFAVTAYGPDRAESEFSNEVSRTISSSIADSTSSVSEISTTQHGSLAAETVVVLPDFASSFAFAGRDRMLVTQKGGFGGSREASVWVVENGLLHDSPVLTLPDVQTRSEMGILAISVDPEYLSTRLVYVLYSHGPSGSSRVVRFRDGDEPNASVELLIEIPIDDCGANQGGSLALDSDGSLYVGTGSGGCGACVAQSVQSLAGKVLRLTREGTIPLDNPFSGSLLFALGLQNPVGLAIDTQDGSLFVLEHAFASRAEINRVRAGGNYGAPRFSCEDLVDSDCSLSNGGNIPGARCHGDGAIPRGIVVYRGERYPNILDDGQLVYGDAATGSLFTLTSPAEAPAASVEAPFVSGLGAIRDLAVSPEGFIYVLTERDIKKLVYAR